MESVLLDAAGHRRSPATMPGYHRGRPPRNKGEEQTARTCFRPPDVPLVRRISFPPLRGIRDGWFRAGCPGQGDG